MLLNIELVKTKKGVMNGLAYQMRNGRGEILTGFPSMVKLWATTSNNERAKAYSVLISFRENRKELEEKLADRGYTLEELIEDVEKLLFVGYSKEELAYSMIAHSDTKHFHIHTYVSNNFAGTGKSLKFWFHERDLAAIREYIDLKYGLDMQTSTKAGRTRKAGSYYWKGEAKEKEEEKDKIHEIIMEDVLQGKIKDNQEVREKMELYTALSEGTIKEVKITKLKDGTIREIDKSVKAYGDKVLVKLYKNSISIIKKDGFKFSLKGGIYRENWTAKKNTVEMEQELLDNLIRYLERRLKETEQRYKKDRQKKQTGYQEEIMGEKLLRYLQKVKAQRQQQQNQNQPQKQQPQKQPANQKQQPTYQKQTQPQKQNQTTSQPQQKQQPQKQPPATNNQTNNQQNLQEQDYIQDYTPRPRFKM
jgi:hypothetical protein